LGGRGRRISEFEASLVYRVSSRTARATQRNPVSKKNKKQKTKNKTKQTHTHTHTHTHTYTHTHTHKKEKQAERTGYRSEVAEVERQMTSTNTSYTSMCPAAWETLSSNCEIANSGKGGDSSHLPG
jgi:ABC-type nickel/cobalt efflux system permease component RcnA